MIRSFDSPATQCVAALALFCSLYSFAAFGAAPVPSVAGPLKVTANSYPFNAASTTAVLQDLSKYGYVEEEYLVSGRANVYDFDSSGKVMIKAPDAPYTTRILVRRPAEKSRFSGNVIVELLNPSLLYDWDPQWMFSNSYFIEHRDIWIGITAKPVAAKALMKFNPERYAALSWANPIPPGKTCAQSALSSDSVPEMENGLIWDIMSQVGALVRSNEKRNPLRGFKVEYLYATGYSQTGAFLLTYINFIRPLPSATSKNGKPVYDGYLIGDGDMFAPPLNQCSQPSPPGVPATIVRPRHEPVISIATEGLLSMTVVARRPDSDAPDDRYRRYEVPAASHGNHLVLGYAPRPGESEKAGVPTAAPKCIGSDKYGITDFPYEYLMNGAFANLDAWTRSNIPPPRAQMIEAEPGGSGQDFRVKTDKHGNAVGGLRTPYLDVPVATYYSRTKPADEKSGNFCGAQGYKVPFEKEKILALYPTRELYLGKISAMVDSMVKARFLTANDGEKIKRDAEKLPAW